jgi:hypothetical protein
VGLYHTKTVYIAEEMTYEIKKQSTEWKKIFTNHIFYQKLISKTHKELK